jgi:hypothetical protein
MSADDTNDRPAQDTERQMGEEAERMQARVEELGEHIDEASKKAQATRELAGERAGGRKEAASGEMETPAVSDEPSSGDEDPGEPLDEVVGESDVGPGDGAGTDPERDDDGKA